MKFLCRGVWISSKLKLLLLLLVLNLSDRFRSPELDSNQGPKGPYSLLEFGISVS